MDKQPELWHFERLTEDEDSVEVARPAHDAPISREDAPGRTKAPISIPGSGPHLSRTHTLIRDHLLQGPKSPVWLRDMLAVHGIPMEVAAITARIRDLRKPQYGAYRIPPAKLRRGVTYYWIEP
jgi:hypothetical protein